MSISFIGMSASYGSGIKPATCTLVMNSLTAMQASLEVPKLAELSDEFHAFLEFLYLRQLRPHCFMCFLNLSECPDVR